jgi:hypothetical protein
VDVNSAGLRDKKYPPGFGKKAKRARSAANAIAKGFGKA